MERLTADEVFRRFEARTNLERGGTPRLRNYRLDRMADILRRLQNPHHRLPVVHIAGSKGKGSTSAYTGALLAASGYRVGVYTSPHVTDYRERFAVMEPDSPVLDGEHPDGADAGSDAPGHDRESLLAREGTRVWTVVESMRREGVHDDELPTTFELLTALAFCYFSASACRWIVLETGLGGRLDATNLCTPAVTLITRIELEHQEYLGDTLEEIAREKAGIIKQGVPLVIAPQRRTVRRVLAGVARDRHAPVIPMERSPVPTLRLAMGGTVQRTNAAQALSAYRVLVRDGAIEPAQNAHLIAALERTRLPGRGEILRDLYLDGAHTPESITQVVRTFPRTRKGAVAIVGIVGGKDVHGIAAVLRPRFRHVIVSRPGTFKPGNPRAVYEAFRELGVPADLVEDPGAALERARAINRRGRNDAAGAPPMILVTGSFYMVAEIRRLLLAAAGPSRSGTTSGRTQGDPHVPE